VRVLATYSIKGGVGKTAAAVNLSYLAAQGGGSTLVWDLDPQGAASFTFRVKPKVKGGARALVRGKRELDDVIKGTDFDGLDLLPADFSYRHLDLVLDATKKPTRRIARLLREVRDEYDWVILDCPPSISLASEGVIEAADAILVPVIPTPLSLRTLKQLSSFVVDREARTAVLPFLSMVDRRKKLHREIVDRLRAERPDLLEAVIPTSVDVERMSVYREPVPRFAPRSPAAEAFVALWDEVHRTFG
jgi:chromosome partitioning protein